MTSVTHMVYARYITMVGISCISYIFTEGGRGGLWTLVGLLRQIRIICHICEHVTSVSPMGVGGGVGCEYMVILS